MNLTNLVLSQWLYERYVVGGVIGTFSVILLAGRITDSVSDPFIAFWTTTVGRWGRRMPFLVLATFTWQWFLLSGALRNTPPLQCGCMPRACASISRCGLVVTPYLALLPGYQ
jgi:hypothetical protein